MKSNRSLHLRWYRGTRSRSCSWRTARRTSTGSWRPTRPNTGCTSNELKKVDKSKWKSDITKEQCSLSTAAGNAALLCPIPINYILDGMDQSFVTELGFKPLSSETLNNGELFQRRQGWFLPKKMNNSIEMWALTNASWHQQSHRTIALYLILSNLSTWARRRTWWWRSRTPSRRPTSRKRSLPDSNFASGVWSAVARDQPGRRFSGISEDRIGKVTRSLKHRTCVPIHMLVLRCFSRVCRGKVVKKNKI